MSMGADTKANTQELVRAPGGLPERLQRRVALEALGESDYSFRTEVVPSQTASTGEEASSEECQGATKANTRELVREVGGLLERLQRRVALETLCDRGSSFGAELVAPKTAFGWVLEVSGEPCQWALTLKRTLGHGSVPQRSHAAPLEPFAQLGDALRSVSPLTSISVDTTEHVAVQAAKQGRRGVSMGADRKANTWRVAAYSNEVTALPVSPSHSAMMPSGVATNSLSSW